MADYQFDGFDKPNYTPIPDVFFDELLPHLSGSEVKVLLYIFRRTFGFGKDADAISLSQFQHGITTKDGKQLDAGCGIKKRDAITKALRGLEDKSIIESLPRQAENGQHQTTIYRLRFAERGSPPVTRGSHQNGLPVVTTGDQGVVTPGDPQETVGQETANNKQPDNTPPPPKSPQEEEDTTPTFSQEQREALKFLTSIGVFESVAKTLVVDTSVDKKRLERLWEALRDDSRIKSKAAVLVKRVREGWEPPASQRDPERFIKGARADKLTY